MGSGRPPAGHRGLDDADDGRPSVLPPGLLNRLSPGVFRDDETVEVLDGEPVSDELFGLGERLGTVTYQISDPFVQRNIRIESDFETLVPLQPLLSGAAPPHSRNLASKLASEPRLGCMDAPTVRIFISYRRSGAMHVTRRLADALSGAFGKKNVFIDDDSIPFGDDFVNVIMDAVRRCDALLILIDRTWTRLLDSKGMRRLDDTADMVRMEVRIALEYRVRVIPVLIDGASMPSPGELPEDLHPLVRRNAVRLDVGSFERDAMRIVDALKMDWEKEGRTALERKDYDAAIEAYGRSRDIANWALAYSCRAHKRLREGDFASAILDAEGAFQIDTSSGYYYDLSMFYLARARVRRAIGDLTGAKSDYREAIEHSEPEKREEVEREASST